MSLKCHSETEAVPLVPAPAMADVARVVVPRHLKTESAVEVGWHSHSEGLLCAVTHGLATMRTDDGTWTLLPRQIGWLPPNTPHCGHSFGKAEALFLYLRPDMCRMMPGRPCTLTMSALSGALMERLGTDTPLVPRPRVEKMLAVLLDEVREAEEVPLHLPLPRDAKLLQMALALNSAPDDATDLDGWARALGIPKRTLIRRFQQETGLGIGQWRQQLRLLKALELLADGNSVTTSALSVGYSSLSAFIASFRQRFGVTPTKYFNRADLRS